MDGFSEHEDNALDAFLEETPSQPHPHPNSPDETPSGDSNGVPRPKKNPVILTLLYGILVGGLSIFTFQVFKPSSSNRGQSPQNQPGYGQPSQNGENIYSNDNGNLANIYHSLDYYGGGGDDSGAEQSGQFRAKDGTTIQYRIRGGKADYSTDGASTWSETPPEGMPPLP